MAKFLDGTGLGRVWDRMKTYVSTALSAIRFHGDAFYSTDGANLDSITQDCNGLTANGLYYYTSNGPSTAIGATTNDGSVFVQGYNDNWVSQIAQDYRTGNLFIRSRNSGTWTAWRKVPNSSDLSSKMDSDGGNGGNDLLKGIAFGEDHGFTSAIAPGAFAEGGVFRFYNQSITCPVFGDDPELVEITIDTSGIGHFFKIGTSSTIPYCVYITPAEYLATPTDSTIKEVTENNIRATFIAKANGKMQVRLDCISGSSTRFLYEDRLRAILNSAISPSSHAEGFNTIAEGLGAHAEGGSTFGIGNRSHAEGSNTHAYGAVSHAEGSGTCASGNTSHAEGSGTCASGDYSHTEGSGTCARGEASHAEGSSTTANKPTIAYGKASHAEGMGTYAKGEESHAEGFITTAAGLHSHAEGNSTCAASYYDHAEGYRTRAGGQYSHAEGASTTATGRYSHAQNSCTSAVNDSSTAMGYYGTAEGYSRFANMGKNITPIRKQSQNKIILALGSYDVATASYISHDVDNSGFDASLGGTTGNICNVFDIDAMGNMFLRGAQYLYRGVISGLLVANGRTMQLEKAAIYMLYVAGWITSTNAFRGINAYVICTGLGGSTTALVAPKIASIGTTGTVCCRLSSTYSGSSSDDYSPVLGIGCCTTAITIRYTLTKVSGSHSDFYT